MARAAGGDNSGSETSVSCPDNYVLNIVIQAWHWYFIMFSFFKLDPSIFESLQKERVEAGDVIYIEANSGAVKVTPQGDPGAGRGLLSSGGPGCVGRGPGPAAPYV